MYKYALGGWSAARPAEFALKLYYSKFLPCLSSGKLHKHFPKSLCNITNEKVLTNALK